MWNKIIVKGSIRKTIFITGAPGMGKTTVAKIILQNLVLIVKHKDNLKNLNLLRHLGIIFDDMGFSHYPREACLSIIDTENNLQFDVKGGMVLVPANVVRIFTSNVYPDKVFNYGVGDSRADSHKVFNYGVGDSRKYERDEKECGADYAIDRRLFVINMHDYVERFEPDKDYKKIKLKPEDRLPWKDKQEYDLPPIVFKDVQIPPGQEYKYEKVNLESFNHVIEKLEKLKKSIKTDVKPCFTF